MIIPPLITTAVTASPGEHVSAPSTAACGGVKGHLNEGYGPPQTIQIAPNERYDPKKIITEEIAQGVGKPGYRLAKDTQYRMDVIATPLSITHQGMVRYLRQRKVHLDRPNPRALHQDDDDRCQTA